MSGRKAYVRPVSPLYAEVDFDPAVLGAKVIAAASTQEKLDIAVKHGGADFTVDYSQPDWQKQVMKITGGKGVDVVYDPVGKIKGRFLSRTWFGLSLRTA